MTIEPENMLKGRMAESLIEELFKCCGYKVYRFGYETVLQNLTQIESSFDVNNEVAQRIRAIPDFIIIGKDKKPIFIEVKFRRNPEGHENDIPMLKRIVQYWPSKIIFVNCSEKPYFRISNPPYINKKNKIVCIDLKDTKELDINKNNINKIEDLVDKYLAPTLKNSNFINKKIQTSVKPVKFEYSKEYLDKIEKIVKKLVKNNLY